jgi:hypothetical protein
MSHNRNDPSLAAEHKMLGEQGDQSSESTQLSWRIKLIAKECVLASKS